MSYRVLFWHNDLGIAGTQATMEQFCNGLLKRGYRCAISYFSDGDTARLGNYDEDVLRYPISREDKSENFQKVLESFAPDIIHVFRSGFPEFPQPQIDFPIGMKTFVEINVFGHIDSSQYIHKTLFMSEYLMRDVARVKQGGRFDFINNPVWMPKNFTDKHEVKRMCGGQDLIVLGRVGRPDNGIYDSICVDAIDILLRKRPELKRKILFYVMSPPSNMIADLKKYEINYVVASPTVDQYSLTKYYNSLDIYCHFRRDGETCGSAIEESMCHKLPAITHVSQPNDPNIFPFQNQCYLVENNVTGFVVDHDPQLYADALEKLIDNPDLRKQMGKAGHKKAMREFEVSVCVKKLDRIYKELLK